MILYADTSVLVKWYVEEQCSAEVETLIPQAAQVAAVSLAMVELVAAVSRTVRAGKLTTQQGADAIADARVDWPTLLKANLTAPLLAHAQDLAWKHRALGLRGYDAIHLAAALKLQALHPPPFTVATLDSELWNACVAEARRLASGPPGRLSPDRYARPPRAAGNHQMNAADWLGLLWTATALWLALVTGRSALQARRLYRKTCPKVAPGGLSGPLP